MQHEQEAAVGRVDHHGRAGEVALAAAAVQRVGVPVDEVEHAGAMGLVVGIARARRPDVGPGGIEVGRRGQRGARGPAQPQRGHGEARSPRPSPMSVWISMTTS
jgi:hypothetical protein